MKNKRDIMIYTVLAVVCIALFSFFMVKAEENRFVIILQLACLCGIWFAVQKAFDTMLSQLDEDNGKS